MRGYRKPVALLAFYIALALAATVTVGALLAVPLLSAVFLTHMYIAKLRRIQNQLRRANGDLNAAEDQLEANEQQLRAVNRQLNAGAEELRDKTEFFNNTIESLHHPFYVVNAEDYEIVLANSAALALQDGYGPTTCYALTHNRDLPCGGKDHVCPVEEIRVTKAPVVVEHTHFDKNGNPLVFEVHGFPVLDRQGNLKQVIEYTLDITDRKRAEKEVAGLAEFPNENPNPVLRISADGKILYGNRASLPLLGAWQCCVGEPVPAPWFQHVTDALESGRPVRAETEVQRRVLSLIFAPVLDSDYVNVYALDITARKKAEQEREQLVQTLASKNKELESILYIASHDLRSPLVNIQGFSQQLSRCCDVLRSAFGDKAGTVAVRQQVLFVLNEDVPQALNFILTSARKMDLLLTGLLRLSRLGHEGMNIEQLDMNLMMAGITQSMEYQIKASQVTVDIDPLPPCCGDASQINQLFSNLLDNALKYLDKSRPGMIHIYARVTDSQSIYCVEDNGVGIAPDHQDRIFETFHRLNPESTGGEGLGLTIVRRIVDRHKGTVRVESEPGRGSRFFVSLPSV